VHDLVDFDLSKFFDRVHHQRLLDRIAQRVSDRRLLASGAIETTRPVSELATRTLNLTVPRLSTVGV
jgi:retron-type reverse transcriptase